MSKEKKLMYFFLVTAILISGCTSYNTITGGTTLNEQSIDDIFKQIDEQTVIQEVEQQSETPNQTEEVQQEEIQINETENKLNESLPVDEKADEFEFSNNSIVKTQNNMSLSLDNLKYEIKGENWGKITGITATLLNKGHAPFKPKLLVILYDEKDFKEEWFKVKATIEFDIDKLEIGQHTTRDAIVNIAFDDIALTKKFELVLTDAANPANKAIVVVEKDFIAK